MLKLLLPFHSDHNKQHKRIGPVLFLYASVGLYLDIVVLVLSESGDVWTSSRSFMVAL